ncbi:MAG: peptidoglycan DD-metalloendopeptidase family protein [Kineosporiaceae bacterium]
MGRSSHPARGRRLLAVLTAAGLLLGGPALIALPTAGADSVNDRKKDLDQQIADLRDTLEGANADFVEAAVALKRAEGRLVVARATLATAQRQLAEATARDQQLSGQLAFAEAEERKAVRDLAAQGAAEEDTRRVLGQIARQAYTGTEVTALSIVLQAESPEQLTERLSYAGAALRAQNGAIDRLTVQQAEMRARGTRLAAVRAQIAELKRQSAIVVAQRTAAQDAAAAAEAEVTGLVTQQQQAVTTIQGKIADEKDRLDALSAEQAKLKAILVARARAAAEAARRRAGQKGHGSAPGPPAASGGFLAFPVSAPISSGFGMRYHPILHISRMHTGTDFAAACGTPVYAAADGEVISAGWAGGYGNRVVIDHGYVRGVGLATTYNHLSRVVRHGGSVSQGQLIAYSGTTGLSTGCHLHFETLANGDYVNPMRWL